MLTFSVSYALCEVIKFHVLYYSYADMFFSFSLLFFFDIIIEALYLKCLILLSGVRSCVYNFIWFCECGGFSRRTNDNTVWQ